MLTFNFRYAAQNLLRGGLWTVFAVICIAAGVSSVVALRGLGLAIEEALVSDIRTTNHGDISMARGEENPFAALAFATADTNDPDNFFSEQQLTRIRAYIEDDLGGMINVYHEGTGVQITPVDAVTAGRPQFVSTFFIEPTTFSLTGPIPMIEPAGTALTDVLTEAGQIVVSENFAEANSVGVGDPVRVSGAEDDYTIVGVVATEQEAGFEDLIASFFGFGYLHIDAVETILDNTLPNRVSMILPEGTDLQPVADRLNSIAPRSESIATIDDLEEAFSQVGDVLGRLIVTMGLGALLIGGVGIINTMLVMVRRRTMEIATLKTFGARGGEIGWLFVTEAFLLGLMGSIVGIIIGVALGGLVNQYGEAFLQQSLAWRLHPEAALYGLVLGLSITVVFGVLPVFTAMRVRPAIVLRPNEISAPTVGILRGLAALMLVVGSVGVMVGSILGGQITGFWWGDMLVGLAGVAGTLAVLGILVGILWILVWIIGRLPAFGIIDLRLALRNLTSRRTRTATTLLALIAGMFALSSITFTSQSIREVINFQLGDAFGGNVLVFPLTSFIPGGQGLTNSVVNARINSLDGVEARTELGFYGVEVTAINGEQVEARVIDFGPSDDVDDDSPFADQEFTNFSIGLTSRESNNPNLAIGGITAGRDLTPEDDGAPVIVLSAAALEDATTPVAVGDRLTVEMNQNSYELEVVGLFDAAGNFADAYIPPGALGTARPEFGFTTLLVSNENLNTALLELSNLPLTFVLDISFIDGLFSRLVDQFSALPTLIGLLALLAAAAIMANTVMLSTLERRKQIGVLKAIGLKGRRVLLIMLLENTLIALLGAGIGIGLSALMSVALTANGIGNAIVIPPNAVPLTIVLVAAAVAISWLSTVASAGVVTREPVTTVLRYD